MEEMISVDLLANDIGDRDATWFGSVVFGHDSGCYGEVLLDYESAADGEMPLTAGDWILD